MFAGQCSLITNSSVALTDYEHFTDTSLSNIIFKGNDIGRIISTSDPNKTHDHDMINIRMLRICGDSIYKHLRFIFRACLEHDVFPQKWEKLVLFLFIKNEKQSTKNYRPVSFHPICGKIFEWLIYNNLFSFFIKNGLISQSQSGFKPGDSCINQLLQITHEICKSSGLSSNPRLWIRCLR